MNQSQQWCRDKEDAPYRETAHEAHADSLRFAPAPVASGQYTECRGTCGGMWRPGSLIEGYCVGCWLDWQVELSRREGRS